jgi:hypothetical protein
MIPASSAPFFQEYNFATLDPVVHAPLVMERILAYGNRSELRWLFDTYGKTRLKTWAAENGARLLPARRYHLWCVLFEIAPRVRRAQAVWVH